MKSLLKRIANGLALLLVLPCYLLYFLGSCALGQDKAFPGWSQAFSLLPGLAGMYLRRAFYRLVLRQCAGDSCLGFGTVFSHPTASVGRRVYVGLFCCLGSITLEDDVLIGSHVSVANGGMQHGIDRLDIPVREQPGSWPHITIGKDSWIGDRAIVLANVGKHCVIGAGSVVIRDIPDYGIAVGSPAKVIRYRNEAGQLHQEPPRAGSSSRLESSDLLSGSRL
jgi:acetyltransferase-like isoleucine patch superfamily enzyme